MRYLLYYRDTERFAFDSTWIDKFCGFFGVHPVPITNLEEMVHDERFHGFAWVWLNPHADCYLGKLTVPRDDVVFVVGHNEHGFYGYQGEGQHVKLLSMHPDGVEEEYHASVAATLMLCRLYL